MIVFRVVSSAVAGLIATAPMTVVMLILYRFLPWHERYELPPGQVTDSIGAKSGVRLRGIIDRVVTWTAHFGMGAVSGAFYAPLSVLRQVPTAAKGAVFGLSVWGANYMGILPAAEILPPATRHPMRRNALMIAAHLVWGSVLAVMADAVNQNVRAWK